MYPICRSDSQPNGACTFGCNVITALAIALLIAGAGTIVCTSMNHIPFYGWYAGVGAMLFAALTISSLCLGRTKEPTSQERVDEKKNAPQLETPMHMCQRLCLEKDRNPHIGVKVHLTAKQEETYETYDLNLVSWDDTRVEGYNLKSEALLPKTETINVSDITSIQYRPKLVPPSDDPNKFQSDLERFKQHGFLYEAESHEFTLIPRGYVPRIVKFTSESANWELIFSASNRDVVTLTMERNICQKITWHTKKGS